MKITLVRHAQSEYNQKGLLQGRIDCSLSSEGEKETMEVAKNFDGSKYDVCFASPLKRTLQTAKILVPNMEIICDDRLIERSLGDWEGTPKTDEKIYLLNLDSTPPNGESDLEITKRLEDFIKYAKENYSDKHILVISHAGIVYALQKIFGLEVKPINNLETLTVDIEEK